MSSGEITGEPKTFTCITCPRGCAITAKEVDGQLVVSGNGCKRGVDYASSEYYHPSRVLTTTIRVEGGRIPLIPVRSTKPVLMDKIIPIMDQLAKTVIPAPIKMGEVLIQNIQGTGVNIVASRSLDKAG